MTGDPWNRRLDWHWEQREGLPEKDVYGTRDWTSDGGACTVPVPEGFSRDASESGEGVGYRWSVSTLAYNP